MSLCLSYFMLFPSLQASGAGLRRWQRCHRRCRWCRCCKCKSCGHFGRSHRNGRVAIESSPLTSQSRPQVVDNSDEEMCHRCSTNIACRHEHIQHTSIASSPLRYTPAGIDLRYRCIEAQNHNPSKYDKGDCTCNQSSKARWKSQINHSVQTTS